MIMSASLPMIAAIPSRRRGWSSTLNTRILGCSFTVLLRRECDPRGYRQFHFGPCLGAAPHSEARANPVGALAHPRQSPVSVAARVQHVRIDAASVVAHEDA